MTCYLRSGGSTNALQTPRDPSLSLTVATTSPAGGSQAHPSCSHGTLGSEAVGFLTLVPRSSSRADLPAGQQQALCPGMWLRGEWGQLQIHPWASRRQSLEETGGVGASLPSTRAGPRWPKGQGRARPGETCGRSAGVSPHSAELPAPTRAAATQTLGAAQAHQRWGRSATLM